MHSEQIAAAKALVRASYTQGRYTGAPQLVDSIYNLAAALRQLEPVGPVDQAQAAELLGSGAAVTTIPVAPWCPTEVA